MPKDWDKATNRVLALIDRECRSILERECRKVLARFPKAQYVAVREGMGSVWIEIDNVNYHYDYESRDFYVVGCVRSRNIKAWRLMGLALAMDDMGANFLDAFHAAFPDVEVRREAK